MDHLKHPSNQPFCVILANMCEKFGRSPSDYFFNGLECAHTRLVIDMTVYNVFSTWRSKIEKDVARKQRLNNARK